MIKNFFNLALRSPAEPRTALRQVLDLSSPVSLLVQAGLLIIIAGVLLMSLGVAILPPPKEFTFITNLQKPLVMTVMQVVVLLMSAVFMHGLGRAFGGQGAFLESLTAVIWLQFILLLLQVAQVVLLLTFPVAAGVLNLAAIFLIFYLIVNFTMEVHGFTKPFLVLLGVFAALIGAGILSVILLTALGMVPMEIPQNV